MEQKTKSSRPEVIVCTDHPLAYRVLYDYFSPEKRRGLQKLIILPDFCPGKCALPVGVVAVYNRRQHIVSVDYIGQDIGCGMLLATFGMPLQDFEYATYRLAANEDGRIGGGNHFIDLYEVIRAEFSGLNVGDTLVLIHSGRNVVKNGVSYIGAIRHAEENRKKLLDMVEQCARQKPTVLFDRPHNTIEVTPTQVIYRKGAVKVTSGQYNVIPSSMVGEAVIVRATEAVSEFENSLPHGTGRKMSIRMAKETDFDSVTAFDGICIPSFISEWVNDRARAPHCYRTIGEILPHLERYAQVHARLKLISHVSF